MWFSMMKSIACNFIRNKLFGLVKLCPFQIKHMSNKISLTWDMDVKSQWASMVKKVRKFLSSIAKSCGITQNLVTATQELRSRSRLVLSKIFWLPWIDDLKSDLFSYVHFWSAPTPHFLYLWIQEKCSHDLASFCPETRDVLPLSCGTSMFWP